MRIWIDLANSPQVLFFRPIIAELEHRGHSATISTRRFAQTIQLAERYKMRHTPIGSHGGKKLSKIGVRIIDRSWRLMRFAHKKDFDLAVSHNSYSQALAAAMLRIPFITLMDYEHQPANHLCFRLAKKVIVPHFFPVSELRKYGASSCKTEYYHGTKEQVYLADFKPQIDYAELSDIPTDKVIVVMRPPGNWGLYHHFDNPLFDRVLEYIAGMSKAHVVFLPRIPSQADAIRAKGLSNIWIPAVALDGPNLLYHADLVISGGGTINREAAVLGIPAYSLFKGKLAAVDRYLIEQGRMFHIEDDSRIDEIKVEKKHKNIVLGKSELVDEICHSILH